MRIVPSFPLSLHSQVMGSLPLIAASLCVYMSGHYHLVPGNFEGGNRDESSLLPSLSSIAAAVIL